MFAHECKESRVARSQEVARVLSKCLGTRHTYRAAKPFEDRTEILISIPWLINYQIQMVRRRPLCRPNSDQIRLLN